MMLRKWMSLATSATVFALLLTSCSPAVAPATIPQSPTPLPKVETPAAKPTSGAALTPTPKAAAEQPRYGGTLTIGTGGDPPSLDPHQETTQFTLGLVAPSYNSIVRFDPLAWPEAKIVSDLAESWQASADGLQYTFRFPKGINWHDGTPFSSADARFSIERIREPTRGMRSPRSGLFQVVDRIETPDAETLVLRLKYRTASFVPSIAMGWNVVLPKHVIQQKGDMKKDVLGTGPFKFKSYSPGVGYDMVKNTGYFLKDRPYLDGIKWYIIRDSSTRFSALRTGRLLMITPVPGISAPEAELIEQSAPNLVVKRKAITAVVTIQINVRARPWDDLRVRQTVNLAFDREACIQAALQGRGVTGGLLYPEGVWSRPRAELLKKPGYQKPTETDIANAKRMLGEAGFPDGFRSTVLARMDLIESTRTAELFKAEMAKVGIDLSIELKESAAYYDALEKRSFNTATLSIGLHLDDPDAVFPECYTTGAPRNYMGYSDPKVDELSERQSRVLDKEERLKLVRQIEDAVMEANPALIACWLVRIAAHSNHLRDYKAAPGIGFNNMMQEVWLAK